MGAYSIKNKRISLKSLKPLNATFTGLRISRHPFCELNHFNVHFREHLSGIFEPRQTQQRTALFDFKTGLATMGEPNISRLSDLKIREVLIFRKQMFKIFAHKVFTIDLNNC